MLCSLLAVAVLGVPNLPSTLLVGGRGLTLDQVRQAVGERGTVQPATEAGFFSVNFKGNAATVERKLRERGIAYVFPPSAATIDRESLPSVRRHIEFVKARAKILGTGDNYKKSAGFYEALAYYLETRVGPDGTVDRDAIMRAVAQREKLPPAWIGRDTRAPSLAFNYVGPKDLDIPQVGFYGTPPLSGRVNGIAYAKSNPNVIYLATAGGGVWKTTDQGGTWAFKSSNWSFLHTTSVAVHPTNENHVLVGTGDYYGMFGEQTFGIMRSTNGGTSWTNVGDLNMVTDVVTRIVFNPDNPDIVLALTNSFDGDIWRSTDGGVTWARTNAPSASWDDIDYGIRQQNVREFYAVSGNSEAGGKIYRSTDAGATWSAVSDATSTLQPIMDVACSKKTFGKVWVLHPGSDTIYRTSNSGTSWTNLNLTSEPTFPNAFGDDPRYNWGQDTYDLYVETALYENTEILYCGLITLAYSTSDGNTWSDLGRTYQVDARLHNDQHCFAPHPDNGSIGLVGGDGGVFRIQNMPGLFITIASLNDDLYTTQFYHMSVHPTNSNYVMGGTQDNASPASRGSLSHWKNLMGGDGSWSAFQPSDPSIHYSSAQRGSVYRYSSSGDPDGALITPEWSSVNFIAPMVVAGSSQVLVGANATVWRWTGISGVWLPSTAMGSDPRSMAVGISNPSRVYAGCDNGSVYRSDDQGETFTKIDTASLPNGPIGAIACKATSSTDVLVGLQQSTGGLYVCRDTTAASPVWTDVSGSGDTGLPSSPVNAVIWDPYQPSVWYVGLDVGAFMTTDSGATWRNMNSLGIGNVHVNGFAISDNQDYLYVATFGRGIWRIPLVNNTLTSFSTTVSEVIGGRSLVGTVTISSPAPPGTTVALIDNSSYVSMPSSITITQGSTAAGFTIDTSQVFSSNRTVTLNATCLGTTLSTTLIVKPYPTVASFTLAKTYLYGGSGTSGTATLSAPAPFTDSFTFTDNSAFVSVVSPITIAAGATTRTTNISTTNPSAVQQATITAAYKGTTRTATLSVYPKATIQSFEFLPNPLLAGFFTLARVTLTSPAPITTELRFTESSPHISIPTTRTMQAGASVHSLLVYGFQPPDDKNIPVSVAIVGDENNTTNAVLDLYRSELTSATSSPNPIQGGKLGVLTVNINRALPANRVVSLSSSDPLTASVPPNVTLVAGQTSLRATITTTKPATSRQVTLSATYLGTTVQTTLTVTP